MTTTATAVTAPPREVGGPADTRRTAFVAGALYLVTIATSVPALGLYAPVLNHAGYVVSAGADTRILLGGLLEVIMAVAAIGTAVVLFPVLRRQNEAVALGFVTARIVEAGVIIVGVVSLLSVVTLRQDLGAGGDHTSLLVTAKALVAIHDWTFLLGPGVVPAVNALCLGYLLHRSRLVPRAIPTLGLIGAPLLIASAVAVMFGAYGQVSAMSAVATVPIALWEAWLGVWLVTKGFLPAPLIAPTTAGETSIAGDAA